MILSLHLEYQLNEKIFYQLQQQVLKHTPVQNPPTTNYNPVRELRVEVIYQQNNYLVGKNTHIFTHNHWY